ncbi:5343_t:CDS:2 [Racocetra fulgida]|uniref:5343_t:CDS:1 n=1 Tax=Racocetra fulgida TaxID=60492 RepID=A0A9N8Z935_9GLOM|nr:5343_t:CDS:2 [Racocetra fulgida]
MSPRNNYYEENIARLPKALRPLAQFMVTPLVDPRKQQESILSNPFALFTFLTKKKVQPKVFMSFKNFNDIPIEFLAMICKHLEPNELFILSGVCKNLRTLLLDTESPATQEIWRNSRLEFCPFLQLSPPKGMQIKLREHYDRRRLEHTISFRKERLQEIIEEFEAERKESSDGSDNESIHSNSSNSSNSSPKYDAQLLRKCPIISAEWKMFDQPFTSRDQTRFRRKLDYEYQILAKHYVS